MDQIKKNLIAYAELLNRCWDDPEFLAKFKEDPAPVLEEYGIRTIKGARYHVVEAEDMKPDTQEDIYLPYKDTPEVRQLSVEELSDVAGGGFVWKSSNVVVRSNIAVDTQGAVESMAAAVTVEVAALYG